MKKFTHKLVAGLAASTIAVSGFALTPAFAQDTDADAAVSSATVLASLIDASQTGSLTVHKFSNNSNTGIRADGTEITDTSSFGDPLSGATFRVTKVENVDLTTNAGWEAAQAIADGSQTATLGSATTATTGADGTASFDNLEIGLYYVEETAAPVGHEITVEPFYVTVPMTNPQNNTEWMYDLHVYPKNAVQTDVITKTVTDENAITVGDEIDFSVTVKIPSAQNLEDVEITDIYPADRLGNPQVTSVTLGDGTAVTDYTLDTATAGQATVVLGATARGQLDNLSGDDRTVVVNFRFDVTDNPDTDAADPIENRAMVYAKGEGQTVDRPDPNDPDDPRVIPPNDPSAPRTYFGNVRVTKESPNNEPLADVEFDLYRCNDDKGIDADNLVLSALTTDASGQLFINGLHVNDFVNGAAGTTDPTGYCLVEVRAAAGHSLLAEPAYFQVLKGAQDAQIDLTSVELTNVEDNAGFQLPFTGGDGVTLLLIIGGLIIVVGGGYAYAVNRRKA